MTEYALRQVHSQINMFNVIFSIKRKLLIKGVLLLGAKRRYKYVPYMVKRAQKTKYTICLLLQLLSYLTIYMSKNRLSSLRLQKDYRKIN